MERKLSDKERFIIQVAVNRSAENHFDRQKGWKRVKRCTNNGYIDGIPGWLFVYRRYVSFREAVIYLSVTSLFIPRQFPPHRRFTKPTAYLY